MCCWSLRASLLSDYCCECTRLNITVGVDTVHGQGSRGEFVLRIQQISTTISGVVLQFRLPNNNNGTNTK